MKKLCFMLVFVLMASSSTVVFAQPGKNGNGNNEGKNAVLQMADNLAIEDSKAEKDAVQKIRKEKKQLVLKQYTDEELAVIEEAGERIENADPNATALGADSIVSTTKKFKFDTPPVIKGNRTLIPVRAITEGLGADLSWDAINQQVTITDGTTTIMLTLGSNIAIVNGQEVSLDSSASIMNNRTYVPMRFIMETFKMKVTYDDGTIEIEDPVTDETTSDGAIDIDTTSDGAIDIDTTSDGAIDADTTSGSAIE